MHKKYREGTHPKLGSEYIKDTCLNCWINELNQLRDPQTSRTTCSKLLQTTHEWPTSIAHKANIQEQYIKQHHSTKLSTPLETTRRYDRGSARIDENEATVEKLRLLRVPGLK